MIRVRGFRLRLWHLFVVVAIAAIFVPRLKIMGINRAVLEIEDLQLNLDQQWGKRWATFDCRFIAPRHLKGQPFHCFIEVDKEFTFGGHQAGDRLKFFFQETEFWDNQPEDPRRLVLKKFFGLQAVPSKHEDGLYIRIGLDDLDDDGPN